MIIFLAKLCILMVGLFRVQFCTENVIQLFSGFSNIIKRVLLTKMYKTELKVNLNLNTLDLIELLFHIYKTILP